MEEKLNQFKELIYEITDLGHSMAILDWDQQTYMPPSGAEDRGDLLSTLASIQHQKATSDEMSRLLDDLKPLEKQLDYDSDDAALLRYCQREFGKMRRVPTEYVAEFAQVTAVAHSVWEKAKNESNFALFEPNLNRIVEMRRQYASFFAPYEHVYDPLLDDFEPGMLTKDVQAIFDTIRPQQVELIRAIGARPQVDDSFLHQPFSEKDQWEFGVEAATAIGYDWKRGRQDKAMHPFTTSFGIDDARITTHIEPNFVASAIFSTIHETGHALYELGPARSLRRTPLCGGASYAMHESQSRLYENLVGRSFAFWKYFYPRLQSRFSSQLGSVSLEKFYKGINRVEPSLIRTEADEATYNLHIMLRLEIEIALMDGSLKVHDLPEVWNARVKEYLGLTPPDDAHGVLQDVHWSGGSIGYFATYALGNLISVQIWEKMVQDIPDIETQFERSQFGSLLDWLRKHVHSYGAKYQPQEIVRKVTGSKIDPKPYINYLKTKYSEIYGF